MFFFLVACASTDNVRAVLDDVDAAAADVDSIVAEHVAAVSAAADTDAVAALEADYSAAWADTSAALVDALDMVSQCAMDDADGMAMDDAMSAMEAMAEEVTTHSGAGCATLDDCTGAEATHQAAMTGYTDAVRAAATDWDDGSMECAMGGMGGM